MTRCAGESGAREKIMEYIIKFEEIDDQGIDERDLNDLLKKAEMESDLEIVGHDYDDTGFFLVDMA
jgi:hypothetical protein